MDRRSLAVAAVAPNVGNSGLHAGPPRELPTQFELRFYHLGNDLGRKPLEDLLANSYLPFCRNSGIAPISCFNVSARRKIPVLVALPLSPSLSAMESFADRLASNPTWKPRKKSGGSSLTVLTGSNSGLGWDLPTVMLSRISRIDSFGQ